MRDLWKERTGEDPTSGETIEVLFRIAVEASLPSSVQTTLKKVISLLYMTYAVWAAHITQYIDNKLDPEKKDLVSL